MKLTLGAFIALLRKEKNLTQREFAEMLSVSDKTVSHWECDKTSPDISLLPVIADIFGITVDELLRSERKTEKKEENTENESRNTGTLYALEIAFNKYRTKNFISIALTAISLFGGFLVSYFKTTYAGYLVFLALLIIPVLLTAVFRGSFSSHLVSPYTQKEVLKSYAQKANRITILNLYFSFVCFVLYSSRIILFYDAAYALIFLMLIFAAVLIFLCEILLRKRELLSPSGKAIQIKKKALLKVLCCFLCVLLLYGGYVSHMSIDAEIIAHNKAEYTTYSEEEFIALIETDKPAPENLFGGGHFRPDEKGTEYTFYKDFGYDNTVIEAIEESNEVNFIYNNLEIADYSAGPDGFRVYTHEQLLEAEKEAEKEVSRLITLHFVYYFAAVLFSVGLYFVLKKLSFRKNKSENITIKDF